MAAHAVHLTQEEIETLARHDVSIAHCPSSNLKLASGLAPEGPIWVKPLPDQLLYLGVGQTSARYSVDVERRTVTVEHIVVGWEGRTQATDPSRPG